MLLWASLHLPAQRLPQILCPNGKVWSKPFGHCLSVCLGPSPAIRAAFLFHQCAYLLFKHRLLGMEKCRLVPSPFIWPPWCWALPPPALFHTSFISPPSSEPWQPSGCPCSCLLTFPIWPPAVSFLRSQPKVFHTHTKYSSRRKTRWGRQPQYTLSSCSIFLSKFWPCVLRTSVALTHIQLLPVPLNLQPGLQLCQLCQVHLQADKAKLY